MAISQVDMTRALESKSYAAKVMRSTQISADQKGQIVAKYGAETVQKWMEVDGTKYEIDDVSYDKAKEAGRQTAEDKTGYDGSKNHGAWLDLGMAGAGAAVQTATLIGGKGVVGKALATSISIEANKKVAEKTVAEGTKKVAEKTAAEGSKKVAKKVNRGDIITVAITTATLAKYLITKPNEDQYEAAKKLKDEELPAANIALAETQDQLREAGEAVTEMTEDAEDLNKEANETIEDDKTQMDFHKARYDELKAKRDSEKGLTMDEKYEFQKLAPVMQKFSEDITETNDETSDELNELHSDITDMQDEYDTSAENIAEVEGVTSYAEGFDESTRTMCYVEGAAMGLNGAAAGIAGGKILANSAFTFGTTTAIGLLGLATAAGSTVGTGVGIKEGAMMEQLRFASEIGDEIDVRRDTQDFSAETTDVYDEELDNFEGNIEIVEDLEIDIPDDTSVPTDTAVTSAGGETDGVASSTTSGTQTSNTTTQTTTDTDKDKNKKTEEKEDAK